MVRTVHCVKLGKDLPGLEKQPFLGALGERLYNHVSSEAYDLWLPHTTTITNHFSLNPADPETRRMLRVEMSDFYFGSGDTARTTANLTPDTIKS